MYTQSKSPRNSQTKGHHFSSVFFSWIGHFLGSLPCGTRKFPFWALLSSLVIGDSTKILAEKLQKQKKVDIKFKPIKGADHFYENYSNQFIEIVDKYIKENIN